MNPNEVSDRLELRDLVQAYAEAVDRRNVELFTSLFAEGAVLTVHREGMEPGVTTGENRLAAIPPALNRYRKTFHFVGNHRCQINGDEASGETYCQAHHLIDHDDGTTTDHVMTIRYADTYVRTGDRWQFRSRDLQQEWTHDHFVSDSER